MQINVNIWINADKNIASRNWKWRWEINNKMKEMIKKRISWTIINMIKALMEKSGNMKEQMSHVNSKIKLLRKNEKEMLEIKNTVTKEKNGWAHLGLDAGKNFWAWRCDDKKLQTWKAITKRWNKNSIQESWNSYERGSVSIVGIPKGREKEKGTEATFESKMELIFSQINVRFQTMHPRISDYNRQDKWQEKQYLTISYKTPMIFKSPW